MDMCLSVWYRLDLRDELKFGEATEGVLIDAFSDGRLCSVVIFWGLSSGDCRNKFFKGHCVEIDKE